MGQSLKYFRHNNQPKGQGILTSIPTCVGMHFDWCITKTFPVLLYMIQLLLFQGRIQFRPHDISEKFDSFPKHRSITLVQRPRIRLTSWLTETFGMKRISMHLKLFIVGRIVVARCVIGFCSYYE